MFFLIEGTFELKNLTLLSAGGSFQLPDVQETILHLTIRWQCVPVARQGMRLVVWTADFPINDCGISETSPKEQKDLKAEILLCPNSSLIKIKVSAQPWVIQLQKCCGKRQNVIFKEWLTYERKQCSSVQQYHKQKRQSEREKNPNQLTFGMSPQHKSFHGSTLYYCYLRHTWINMLQLTDLIKHNCCLVLLSVHELTHKATWAWGYCNKA